MQKKILLASTKDKVDEFEDRILCWSPAPFFAPTLEIPSHIVLLRRPNFPSRSPSDPPVSLLSAGNNLTAMHKMPDLFPAINS